MIFRRDIDVWLSSLSSLHMLFFVVIVVVCDIRMRMLIRAVFFFFAGFGFFTAHMR